MHLEFSALLPRKVEAGTHITPHCGVSNGKLRVHIGVHVPYYQRDRNDSNFSLASPLSCGDVEGAAQLRACACGIRVGGEVRQWHEGEAMIFDDSFEHEVPPCLRWLLSSLLASLVGILLAILPGSVPMYRVLAVSRCSQTAAATVEV